MTEPMDCTLPEGFADLEPYVAYWAGEDVATRWDRRARADMPRIQAFYAVMVARADAALAYLQPRDIATLDGADARLFRLVLSLATVAMAVELHGQPRAPYSPFPHAITIVRGPRPFA